MSDMGPMLMGLVVMVILMRVLGPWVIVALVAGAALYVGEEYAAIGWAVGAALVAWVGAVIIRKGSDE